MLVLRTLLVDGEVFIRVHKRPSSPYKMAFEVLDTLDIDYTKIRDFAFKQNGIKLGVEIDQSFKPVAYYIRKEKLTTYLAGNGQKLPATDIIPIFRRERAHQTRGIPPLNAVINDLNQLDEYQTAELAAAKLGASLSIFYERNEQPIAGNVMAAASDEEPDMTIGPGTVSKVASGYNVKTLTATHPNTQYGDFVKSVMMKICASLGMSYNKVCKDYSSVNYSSLREATIDESSFFAEIQSFLIEAWKEVEFKLFVNSLSIDEDKKQQILMHHTWICQKRGLFDKSKEILAAEREISLGLKSPVQYIEESGMDTEEVLKSFQLWNKLCKSYGLDFKKDDDSSKQKINAEDQDFNDENVQDEAMNKERD